MPRDRTSATSRARRPSWPTTVSSWVWSIGYPAGGWFSQWGTNKGYGEYPHFCYSPYGAYYGPVSDPAGASGYEIGMGCTMTGGASGGPWFAYANGHWGNVVSLLPVPNYSSLAPGIVIDIYVDGDRNGAWDRLLRLTGGDTAANSKIELKTVPATTTPNAPTARAKLVVESLTLTPKPPRAGRALKARLIAVRDDTGERLRSARVTCRAVVGARVSKGRGVFGRGAATCTWTLPRTTRAKRVSGRVAIGYLAPTVSRGFVVRVR